MTTEKAKKSKALTLKQRLDARDRADEDARLAAHVEKTLKYMPGTVGEKVEAIRAIEKLPDAVRATIMKMMEVCNKVEKAFSDVDLRIKKSDDTVDAALEAASDFEQRAYSDYCERRTEKDPNDRCPDFTWWKNFQRDIASVRLLFKDADLSEKQIEMIALDMQKVRWRLAHVMHEVQF